MFTDIIMFIL